MMRIERVTHVGLLVADLGRSLRFYHGILGLPLDPTRPDFGFPGVWLNVGNQQIHLLQLPNPDPVAGRPEHGGRDRHIAFSVIELEGLRRALEEAGIPYTWSRSGRRALFCRDPDGNALEFSQAAG